LLTAVAVLLDAGSPLQVRVEAAVLSLRPRAARCGSALTMRSNDSLRLQL
jgi:hypothetical protein